MNEFVEACRREWRRLGVPAAVADEMAAELAADLDEAAAEGASAEAVLGSDALDPGSFAASWAAERHLGGVPAQPRTIRRRYAAAAAAAALAGVAIAGGVLVVVGSAPGPARVALTGPSPSDTPGRSIDVLPAPPPDREVIYTVDNRPSPNAVWVTAPTVSPDGRMIALPGTSTPVAVVEVESRAADTNARTLGWVLLTVGLAGIAPLTMLWLSRA